MASNYKIYAILSNAIHSGKINMNNANQIAAIDKHYAEI